MTPLTLKIARHALLAALFVSTAAVAAPADHHDATPAIEQHRIVWVDAALVGPHTDPNDVMISNADAGN